MKLSRQFAKIRKRLVARRHQLQDDLKQYDTWQLSDLGYGDALVDDASLAFDQPTQLTLRHKIAQRLKLIDRALARLDNGTYGICEGCGDHIHVDRLEAVPDTRLCVACQRLQERSPLGRLPISSDAAIPKPAVF